MHDSEQDTFVQKNKTEQFCDLLETIGIEAKTKEIGTDDVEKGDYYSKNFTHSPIMVTNHGCIKIKNTNIDVVQIIQKG
ncbi:MAG: hypothetical protein E6L05_02900 [Thaumarchaeota archaeon]|nr:MAG: hypothetical protein E6L05_02900 [Nitrososphaerota archaeon]